MRRGKPAAGRQNADSFFASSVVRGVPRRDRVDSAPEKRGFRRSLSAPLRVAERSSAPQQRRLGTSSYRKKWRSRRVLRGKLVNRPECRYPEAEATVSVISMDTRAKYSTRPGSRSQCTEAQSLMVSAAHHGARRRQISRSNLPLLIPFDSYRELTATSWWRRIDTVVLAVGA
jgi:hypothetical protein